MIVTLTGASGVGKTSVARKLTELMPSLTLVMSLTSRDPRPSDLPGEYRSNVPLAEFESRKNEFLLVTTVIHGNRYGTLLAPVDAALSVANPHLMIIIPECIDLLRKYNADKGAIFSFYILSPEKTELIRRLRARGENDAAIELRIIDCTKWDEEARHSSIPYHFVRNDEPEIGTEKAAKGIIARINSEALSNY